MKRLLGLLGLLIAAAVFLPAPALAGSHTDSDVPFAVEGGNIWFRPSIGEIVDADKSITGAVIPEQINGTKVTHIGFHAFNGCAQLSSLSIGNNVSYIGFHAFDGCSQLSSLTMGSSLSVIEMYAFAGCTSLPAAQFPDSLSFVGDYAFSGCAALTDLTFQNQVAYIGAHAFSDCVSLRQVTIPASVTRFHPSAFSGCTNLTDLYYDGSQASWEQAMVKEEDASLLSASVHYSANVEGTSNEGNAGNLPGDFDGDGHVNNKDVARLLQALSQGEVDVTAHKSIDLNNDGKVNSKDLSLLLQALAGKDVGVKVK